MPTAFTLVNIELGKDQEVLKGLKASMESQKPMYVTEYMTL